MANHTLNENYNGKTTLRKFWPIVKSNFANLLSWFNAHISGTADRHTAEHIDYDSGTTVKAKIDKEITDRQSGDNVLLGKINTEITNRVNGDNALQNKITAETTNRQNADNALRTDIENLLAKKADEETAGGFKAGGAKENAPYSVTIGLDAETIATEAVAVGRKAKATAFGTAVGAYAEANAYVSTAIGSYAVTEAENAVQIGDGTNANKKTLQFMNYQITDYDSENDKKWLKDVGKLEELSTENKTDIVSVINDTWEQMNNQGAGINSDMRIIAKGLDMLERYTGEPPLLNVTLESGQIKNDSTEVYVMLHYSYEIIYRYAEDNKDGGNVTSVCYLPAYDGYETDTQVYVWLKSDAKNGDEILYSTNKNEHIEFINTYDLSFCVSLGSFYIPESGIMLDLPETELGYVDDLRRDRTFDELSLDPDFPKTLKDRINDLSAEVRDVRVLADKTIDGDKIAANSITGGYAIETPGDIHVDTNGHIAIRTITGDNIDYSTIKGDNIGNKEIKTANIDDKGVTTAKIADKAVGTAQIADKAVTGQQIETKTITNWHMNDGAIQEYAIEDGAVTARKIANGTITADKLASGVLESSFANFQTSNVIRTGTWVDGTPMWRVMIPLLPMTRIVDDTDTSHSLDCEDMLLRLGVISRVSSSIEKVVYIDDKLVFQNEVSTLSMSYASGIKNVASGHYRVSGKDTEEVDYAQGFWGWIEFATPESNIKNTIIS